MRATSPAHPPDDDPDREPPIDEPTEPTTADEPTADGEDTEGDDERATGRGRGPSQASQLRALALTRYRIGVSEDGAPFAVPRVGPQVVRMFRSGRTGLRAELAREYARAHDGAVPSASALADALTALEGEAAESDPAPLALRVAPHGDALVLDLGRADGHAVVISPDGWQVVERSPVLFRRTALTGPLPDPSRSGNLAPLRSRLNVPDADWPLVLGWLVTALLPAVPHPLLLLVGEQGTGKSSATRLLVNVLDPSPAPLRTAPSDVEGWSVAAAASWVVGLDNLSGIQPWLSDALCRAVTGDGLVRRALFTNDDVAVLCFRRVLIGNGIDLGTLRGDLADRMVTVDLHRIADVDRRPDGEVHMPDDERAAVLGSLLDLAAHVLAELPHVVLPGMPRMADFTRVLAAVDVVTGTNGLDRYLGQAAGLAETVVEGDAFTGALRAHMDSHGQWTGTAGDLHEALPAPDRGARSWPSTPRAVSGALRRSAPALRRLGYDLDELPREAGTGRRLWALAAPTSEEGPAGPSRPSQPSRPASDQGLWRDGICDDRVLTLDSTVTDTASRDGLAVPAARSSHRPSQAHPASDLRERTTRDGVTVVTVTPPPSLSVRATDTKDQRP